MRDHGLAFIQALFAACPRGFVTLTAIHPAGGCRSPSRHIRLGNHRDLARALADLQAANRLGWGAYLGMGLRRANLGRWRRGGRIDVQTIPALFVDLDGDPADSLKRLRAFIPPPSCIVGSGGGLHAYWFIQPSQPVARVDRVLRGLAEALGGDPLTVAQSMRLPGTRNTKPGRDLAPCRLLTLYPARRYALDDFGAYVPVARPRPLVHPRPNDLNRADLIDVITTTLLAHYGGFWQTNGWLGALCPLGHCRDRPGAHFGFHPGHGVGFCFGRHGRITLKALGATLGLTDYIPHNSHRERTIA